MIIVRDTIIVQLNQKVNQLYRGREERERSREWPASAENTSLRTWSVVLAGCCVQACPQRGPQPRPRGREWKTTFLGVFFGPISGLNWAHLGPFWAFWRAI